MRKLSMKQISYIVSVLAFAILLVAVIIILNFTKGDVRVDVLKEETRVGLILGGDKNDRSWCQSHYDALSALTENLNLEIICKENVPFNEDCSDTIRSLINDEGCRIVIATSYGFDSYMEKAAEEYPNKYFINVMGSASGKNICSFIGRMYQFRYLSGIIAGNQTKTNSIGYVAALPMSKINIDINAFTLGVRSVNPDAVVHVSFCGEWDDDTVAGNAAEKLITEKNIDVLTTDNDSLAPLEVAEKQGIWSIGCNYDNTGDFPLTSITACVWNWKSIYREKILSCLQGKFHGTSEWLGIESGIMELVDPSRTGNALPGYEEALEKARESFEKHSYDVFYGPVSDNGGNIRVPEGESMSDENMIYNFDWFVEGVEVG